MEQNHQPEQQFFDDPAIDKILGVVMALATEVYVLRDRQRALERMLEKNGTIDLDLLNNEPSNEERIINQADKNEFVEHLMQTLSGLQVSTGSG